jgi:hypothetical protein
MNTPSAVAPTRGTWPAGDLTPWAWAVMSFAAFLISGAVSLLGTGPGLWAVVWTVLAGLGVLGTARLSFGAWPEVGLRAAAVLIGGVALAGAVDGSLRDWATGRFSYFDPELIGVTGLFFAVVVGVAAAGFGALIAPTRRAAWPATLATIFGVVATIFVLIANLGGLADGHDPESYLLAAVMAVAAVYVVIVAVLALRISLTVDTPES